MVSDKAGAGRVNVTPRLKDGILADSAAIDFTSADAGNTITAVAKDGLITFARVRRSRRTSFWAMTPPASRGRNPPAPASAPPGRCRLVMPAASETTHTATPP